jgi:hypothetical protein
VRSTSVENPPENNARCKLFLQRACVQKIMCAKINGDTFHDVERCILQHFSLHSFNRRDSFPDKHQPNQLEIADVACGGEVCVCVVVQNIVRTSLL